MEMLQTWGVSLVLVGCWSGARTCMKSSTGGTSPLGRVMDGCHIESRRQWSGFWRHVSHSCLVWWQAAGS
eukprot:1195497-Prorocentrum_minimum.AAC.5